MATRANICVLDLDTKLKNYTVSALEKHSSLIIYNHWDGYPEGLGEILKEFVDSEVGQGRFFDESYFKASLVTWICDRNRQDMIDNCDNTGFGIQDYLNDDIDYLYVIDMSERTLTCYRNDRLGSFDSIEFEHMIDV